MARALLVGCGCHGRELGRALLAEGWAVRGTSRREDGLAAIGSAGIEPAIADPDRVGTVLDHVGDVTVVAWLLGSASGTVEEMSAAMRRYDPSPIVQQKISGDGAGASLLLDSNGRLISALCHRRIREYPITGGPSTCCVSFYDETKIAQAYELLRSFGFTGMAMVEFKGDSILEVNPRVWGSFPMTECAGSDFAASYAAAASGETVEYRPGNYNTGVKMRFVLNDTAAVLSYLGHGKFGRGFGGIGDAFGAKEALKSADDPAPFRVYLKNTFQRK